MASSKEQRDRSEDKNLKILWKFKDFWSDTDTDIRESGNLSLYFLALVTYISPARSAKAQRVRVRIQLSGYSTTGQIDIYENDVLTVDDYHLQILPSWGQYLFDTKTGALNYTNNSPAKMGGEYKVSILPIASITD